MKQTLNITSILLLTLTIPTASAETVQATANGITYPTGLKNWRIISSSYRNDNDTHRVILGNSIAIKASRANNINPWPKGSILAKLVWKNKQHPQWSAALVPGEFVHSEIMIKDAGKYKSTSGWGYARWTGLEQKPYGKEASFAQECATCHKHAKNSDHIFTEPPRIP